MFRDKIIPAALIAFLLAMLFFTLAAKVAKASDEMEVTASMSIKQAVPLTFNMSGEPRSNLDETQRLFFHTVESSFFAAVVYGTHFSGKEARCGRPYTAGMARPMLHEALGLLMSSDELFNRMPTVAFMWTTAARGAGAFLADAYCKAGVSN